jgi:hypothetical protein
MVSDANLTLQAPVTRSASGAGPALALGAQCDGRGMAARVIVTALTGTATFSLEHSADGASWATAGTVVGGPAYAPGEYVILFATARRDIRLAVALSGGGASVTYQGELAPVRWGEGRERRLVSGADVPPASGPAVLFAETFADADLAGRGFDPAGLADVAVAGGVATLTSPGYLNTPFAGGTPASGVLSLLASDLTIAVGPDGFLLEITIYDASFTSIATLAGGWDSGDAAAWSLSTNGASATLDAADFAPLAAGADLELVAYLTADPPRAEVYVGGALVGTLENAAIGNTPDNVYLSTYSDPPLAGFTVAVAAIAVADGLQGV